MHSLADFAMKDEDSRGRFNKEKYHDMRSVYERDRDRIIHCEAFRKLEYKTQVFVNHEGDYYRTRLTHTMEVSQIARSIAKRLGLNMELVEALSLAHDLGHTPFGHTGEAVLNRLTEEDGGFEHNRQSYRIVTYLERRYPGFNGLNLSFETLEGIIKHSEPYNVPRNSDLQELLDLDRVPTAEAQIIDMADEIAYLNHDLDDGLESGLLAWDELSNVEIWKRASADFGRDTRDRRVKFRIISSIISFLVDDFTETANEILSGSDLKSAEELKEKNIRLAALSRGAEGMREELKAFLYEKMYRHPRVESMRVSAEKCVEGLFSAYIRYPNLFPPDMRKEIDVSGIIRTAADFIAGMTDRYALQEYRRLNNGIY